MLCPECGMDIYDNSNFCSYCGHRINGVNSLSKLIIVKNRYQSNQYFNKSVNIWIATAFFVSVCFLLIFSSYNESSFNHNTNEYELSPDDYDADPIVYLPTASYVFVDNPPSKTATVSASGDFVTGDLSVSFDDEDKMVVTLSDSVASEYQYFYWTFTDLHHTFQTTSYFSFNTYEGKTLLKTEPVLIWNSPTAGEYEIKVSCYNDINGSHSYYSGNVLYDDYITEYYVWSYHNQTYFMDIEYMFSEYLQYTPLFRSPDELRAGSDHYRMADFCIINDTINDIADNLKALYCKSYGTEASLSDQKFADFILAFVNICYTYPPNSNMPDYYEYGQIEYWAYPMETIYHTMGDCEDTAILCSSLFKACGFDSAIIVLPGHAISAVSLDNFTESYVNPSCRVSPFYQIVNDKTYYGCETTLVDSSYGVGYISSSYVIDEYEILQSEELLKGDYRFYPLSSLNE